MAIDKLPSGRWRVRWREHANGPQRQATFARRTDAQRHLDGIRHDLARGTYVDPAGARTMLGEYATAWMAAQPWRPSTRERNESLWRRHIEPRWGATRLGAIRTSDIQAWVTGLQLAPSTAEGALRFLAAILRAAVTDRLIGSNPAAGVRAPRAEPGMLVPLTVDQVRTLAEAVRPELHAAVLVSGMSGLRQGELFGLTWDRVRTLRRELVVDRQLLTPASGPCTFGPPKSRRSTRIVPVPAAAVEALAEHRRAFDDGPDGLVFTTRSGSPWRRSRAAEAIVDARRRTGVPIRGWHDLRHHAASILIASGLGVTAVAATLGHTPAECLATYAHWWPSEDEQVRSAVARAWAQ